MSCPVASGFSLNHLDALCIAKDWQLIRVWTMTKLSKSHEQTCEQELSAELRVDASQTKQIMYLSCTSSVSRVYVGGLHCLIL